MRLSILCVKVLKIKKKKFSCSKIYKKIIVTTPHIERVNARAYGVCVCMCVCVCVNL